MISIVMPMMHVSHSFVERAGEAASGGESQPEAAAAVTGDWQRK